MEMNDNEFDFTIVQTKSTVRLTFFIEKCASRLVNTKKIIQAIRYTYIHDQLNNFNLYDCQQTS